MPTRSSLLAGFVIFSLLWALPANSQNYSGLQGKELSRVDDVGTLVETGLGRIFGGEKISGNITKLTVLEDSERRLAVAMQYTELTGASLKGEILDSQRRVQREITFAAEGTLGQTQPMRLVFSLSDALPKGSEVRSAFLKLSVSKAAGKSPGLVCLYALAKNWKIELDPQNVVLTLSMDPLNTAAQLRQNQPIIVIPSQPRKFDRTLAPVSAGAKTPAVSTVDRTKMLTVKRLPSVAAATPSTPSTAATPARAARYDMKTFPWARPATPAQDKTPAGPDNLPINLWPDLVPDGADFAPTDVSSIQFDIFPDKNQASGIFYYAPARFCLLWTPEEGHRLDVLYGSTPGEGKTESVQMHFTLTAGLYGDEIRVIKRLMEVYKKANPNLVYSDLRILPTRETPQLTLQTAISSLYDIDAKKIAVNPVSSLLEPIRVSIAADSKTMNEIQTSLSENIGISGTMTIKSAGQGLPDQVIPANISLNDEGTFGRFDLDPRSWRTKRWRNPTPYPLRLNHLNVLMVKDDVSPPVPIIYSWKIQDAVAPPQSQVALDASTVPAWLDTDTRNVRMWLDYTVEQCSECNSSIIEKHWHSPTSNLQKQVTFMTFKVFDSLNVDLLLIAVRSAQATPDGKKVADLASLKIDKDRQEFTAGPLYVKEGEEMTFEYKLTLAMKDGNIHASDAWISSHEQNVLIGSKTLRDLFPAVLK